MPSRRDTLRAGMALSAGVASTAAIAHKATRPIAAPRPAIEPYRAACVQTRVLPTFTRDGAFLPEALAANVETVAQAIERTVGASGAKLLVFSEFCLQLPLTRLTAQQWHAGAIAADGPEIERIAQAARRAGAFVVFNPVERIADFPGRYFLSGMLLDPDNGPVLTYRKLYDLTNKTRPGDVLDHWIARFGEDSLFPVADTAIGRIAVTIGTDPVWPEMVRDLVFRGAEVIATCLASPNAAPSHVSQRGGDSSDAHDPVIPVMARRVRAYENLAYMLTANLGPTGTAEAPGPGIMQPSEIVDFHGNVMAASRDGSEGASSATLDIEALRRARCTPGPGNVLLQLQSALHAPGYASARFARANGFARVAPVDGSEHADLQRAEVRDLVARGVLVAPAEGLS